jgi:hypothetical protein
MCARVISAAAVCIQQSLWCRVGPGGMVAQTLIAFWQEIFPALPIFEPWQDQTAA